MNIPRVYTSNALSPLRLYVLNFCIATCPVTSCTGQEPSATRQTINVKCPKEILQKLPKHDEIASVSTFLLKCFQAAQSILESSDQIELFPELKKPTLSGIVPIQCVFAQGSSLVKYGHPSDVKMTGAWNVETKRFLSYQVHTNRDFKMTLTKVIKGNYYPKQSVVDRVLRLQAVALLEKRKPIVRSIDFVVGNISWPSSEIRGVGYIVQVSLSESTRDGDLDEEVAFGAFPLLPPENRKHIVGKSSISPPIPADVLGITDLPGEADDKVFFRR